MKTGPKTIDAYLARLDDGQRAALQKLRTAILAAAPGAEECLSYGVPGFRLDGRVLMHIGAAAKHCAIYPGAYPIRVLGDALEGYDTSKGTIRFAAAAPPPAALVRRLVRARIDEMSAKRPAARAARRGRAPTEPSFSAFGDKSRPPSEADLRTALGAAHAAWAELLERVAGRIGPVTPGWGFTSAKSGWGLRVRSGERVILYMSPRRGSFLVSFALGEKAVAAARARRLPAAVSAAIDAAPRYAEGRGVRFEVRHAREIPALATLAGIKHEN